MERQGKIVLCRFQGSVGSTLLTFFARHLEQVVGPLKGSPWAYLSSSADAVAGTPEAEAVLAKAAIEAHGWGCVQAAYVLTSPIAISQTRNIREKIGVQQPLEDVLFTTEEAAKEYLSTFLAKTEKNAVKPESHNGE